MDFPEISHDPAIGLPGLLVATPGRAAEARGGDVTKGWSRHGDLIIVINGD